MSVCCECCVLSGRGLCDGLVTRPEESYRMWWSTAARVLELLVRIPPGAWMSVCCECYVCCQVEVSATSWPPVQRSPTDCCASECVISKPHELEITPNQLWMSLNRRCVTGCTSYMPLRGTVKHDCWMSSDRLQFLSCKANARVKFAKTGQGPHSSKLVVICVVLLLFVLFYVLSVCKCVL